MQILRLLDSWSKWENVRGEHPEARNCGQRFCYKTWSFYFVYSEASSSTPAHTIFMNLQPKQKPHRIARRAGDQGVPHPVSSQAGDGECTTGRNRHLNLRKECKNGTWNVRKTKEVGKLNTIRDGIERNNIKVLGISETNWNNSNNSGIFKKTNNNSVLLAGKESGYSQGVGIILTKDFANSLLRYHPVNDRIITARIQAKPHNISIIQFYAPTSTAAEE